MTDSAERRGEFSFRILLAATSSYGVVGAGSGIDARVAYSGAGDFFFKARLAMAELGRQRRLPACDGVVMEPR